MPAFALAHLRVPRVHRDLIEYVERIQATLDPFGGRFRVHGGTAVTVEGAWPGDLVLIEFPDLASAQDWWDSPAYQDIKPLRTEHATGDCVLIDGVGPDYDPASKAHLFRGALDAAATRTS